MGRGSQCWEVLLPRWFHGRETIQSAGGTVGRDGTGTSFVFLFLPREGISFGLFTVTSAGIFFIIIIIIIIIIVFAWGGGRRQGS